MEGYFEIMGAAARGGFSRCAIGGSVRPRGLQAYP